MSQVAGIVVVWLADYWVGWFNGRLTRTKNDMNGGTTCSFTRAFSNRLIQFGLRFCCTIKGSSDMKCVLFIVIIIVICTVRSHVIISYNLKYNNLQIRILMYVHTTYRWFVVS